MLKVAKKQYYKVKKGQTLREVAEYFSVSEFLLARENNLRSPLWTGQILSIPKEKGNAYFVHEGDTKSLLYSSDDAYLKKNGTQVFYIGMRVILE